MNCCKIGGNTEVLREFQAFVFFLIFYERNRFVFNIRRLLWRITQ